MKQVAFATIAGLAIAGEAEKARYQLGKFAPYSGLEQRSRQNNYQFARETPDYASPLTKGDTRKARTFPVRKGDELLEPSIKKAEAAIKDDLLAKTLEFKPFSLNKKDNEPIDVNNTEFKSPVFLVDPMFTEDTKDEDVEVFRDNDWAGWKQPKVHSRWPIVQQDVRKFFHVGGDCMCDGEKKIDYKEPHYEALTIPSYYAPVYEPQYKNKGYVVPSKNQKTCYRGDDYGGHNIPFPHPAPPTPDSYYDRESYVNLSDYYGYTTKPVQAKVSADKPRSDKPRSDKRRADKPRAYKPRAKPLADKPRSDKRRAPKLHAAKPRAEYRDYDRAYDGSYDSSYDSSYDRAYDGGYDSQAYDGDYDQAYDGGYDTYDTSYEGGYDSKFDGAYDGGYDSASPSVSYKDVDAGDSYKTEAASSYQIGLGSGSSYRSAGSAESSKAAAPVKSSYRSAAPAESYKAADPANLMIW